MDDKDVIIAQQQKLIARQAALIRQLQDELARWTVIATCAQQGKLIFDFLERAVHAHFTSQPAPSLQFDSS